MANPAPLPPIVSGPIFSTSTQVYVGDLLPNSTVNVYVTGVSAPVGTATATSSPGSIWVPVTTKLLKAGQQITATQTYTGTDPSILAAVSKGVESAHSTRPVTILNPPNPPPTPIFVSGLCTCMDWVYIDGLIAGATLTITMGGTPMVKAAAVTQSPQWFQLDSVAIPAGSVLEAQQNIGASKSPVTLSDPIEVAPALGPPVIKPQPLDCQTGLGLSNLVAGADLKIINGGSEYFATSAWSAWDLVDLAPLQVAPSSAQQYFARRCQDLTGPIAPFTVSKQAPRFPKVSYVPCADVTWLSVSDVVGGEILTIDVSYSTKGGPAPLLRLGACGVSGPGPVPLPNGWYPADAVPGSVTLQIGALLCDQTLPNPGHTSVAVVQPSGPFLAPTVQQPLYDCATSVFVQGANPGSLIQIISGPPPSPPIPRSNPVVAPAANFPVRLWWPLQMGEQIYVTQAGCNANGQSFPAVSVLPPPALPVPTVASNYVLTTAKSVRVKNVVPGAQVTLFLDGAPESQVDSIEAEDGPPAGKPPRVQVSLPVGSSLKVGDVFTAGQTLCNEKALPAAGQGGGVGVQAPVPNPAGGLNGSSNYFFATSGCQNLTSLLVTIQVTEDIKYGSTTSGPSSYCPGSTSPLVGFSFQLNCYSPLKGKPLAAFQQYVIALVGNQLSGLINTYPVSGSAIILPTSSYQIGSSVGVPSAGILPKNYRMTIQLGSDSKQNINTVTMQVFDPTGKSVAVWGQTILSIPDVTLTEADLAPIVAFTLDLTGPGCGQAVVLTAGAGLFTYSAPVPLTVVSANPFPGCSEYGGGTAEHSTSSYGVLPANPGNPFTQSFGVSGTTPKLLGPPGPHPLRSLRPPQR